MQSFFSPSQTPLEKMGSTIHTFMKTANDCLKNLPEEKEIKQTFATLVKTHSELQAAIQKEKEYDTTGLSMPYALGKKQNTLKKEINQVDQQFEQDFTQHQQKIATLRSQRDNIHQQITELRSKETIANVAKIAEDQKQALAIVDKVDALRQEVEELDRSCWDYICCCFFKTPQRIRNNMDDIEAQTRTFYGTNSGDSEQNQIARLEKARDAIDKDLATLEQAPPQSNHIELREMLADIKGTKIKIEADHFHQITGDTMFSLVILYELTASLANKLKLAQTNINANENDPLLARETPLSKLTTLFQQFQSVLNESIDTFFYKNYKGIYFHRKFLESLPQEQAALLDGTADQLAKTKLLMVEPAQQLYQL